MAFMESLVRVRKGKRIFEGAIACDTSGELLCADNPNRESVTFQNQGSVNVLLTGVALKGSGNGLTLAPGASVTDNASDQAWYGTAASGSASVWVVDTA